MSSPLKKRVLHVEDSGPKEIEYILRDMYPDACIGKPNDNCALMIVSNKVHIEAIPRERFPYYVRGRSYDKIVFSSKPTPEELDIAFVQVLYRQGCVFHGEERISSAARFGGDYERRKKFVYEGRY